jgi:hypothetical protein
MLKPEAVIVAVALTELERSKVVQKIPDEAIVAVALRATDSAIISIAELDTVPIELRAALRNLTLCGAETIVTVAFKAIDLDSTLKKVEAEAIEAVELSEDDLSSTSLP